MKNPLEDAVTYLQRVPGGRAEVRELDIKHIFQGRTHPIWPHVESWALQHGLKMTTNAEANRALATKYYFTK